MIECCSENVIHEEIVEKLRGVEWHKLSLHTMALMLKLFADETRLKIIYLLHCETLCVCDLAALLSITQSGVSHQLKGLKLEEVVVARREGKVVYYALNQQHEMVKWLCQIWISKE